MPNLPPVPSRLRCLAAMLYDAVLLFGIIFLASYFFDTLTQSRHGLRFRHQRQAWLFIIIGIYFIVCWCKSGQTLAMKTWGIRLVDQEKNTLHPLMPIAETVNSGNELSQYSYISVRKAFLRYLLSWPIMLSGIGFIWSWFDPEKQFLQDRLLGTRLINAPTHKNKG